MLGTMRRICVFCGSSGGARLEYAEAAHELAAALTARGLGLVFGGGRVGLMGTIADAVLAGGGEVIGVIPDGLWQREVGHTGLGDLRIVGSMHERKALMSELSDGFIALPGGMGTLEELCEVLTWAQLGVHHKPCGLLNVAGYYDPLLALLDHMVSEGFLQQRYRDLVLVERDPAALLDRFARYQSPVPERWLDQSRT